MLGNLWKYECRSIALDKLDSRGQEFKTIFEETRNKLIRDPDEVISDEETFAEFCENKDDSNNNGLNKLDKKEFKITASLSLWQIFYELSKDKSMSSYLLLYWN